MPARASAVVACGLLLSGCNDGAGVYTLYRNSPAAEGMRIHVASFDSKDGDDYNRENCDVAAKLYRGQAGVTARFWCEKGAFRR